MNKHSFIDKVNLSKHLASHIVGENHTPKHRRIAGFFIAVFGLSLAEYSSHLGIVIKMVGDLIGFSLHAIGAIPYLNDLEKLIKEPQKEKKENETACTTC